MNNTVAGIDVGEDKSKVCYLSPASETLEQFNFQMTDIGWNGFASNIPMGTIIASEASGALRRSGS